MSFENYIQLQSELRILHGFPALFRRAERQAKYDEIRRKYGEFNRGFIQQQYPVLSRTLHRLRLTFIRCFNPVVQITFQSFLFTLSIKGIEEGLK